MLAMLATTAINMQYWLMNTVSAEKALALACARPKWPTAGLIVAWQAKCLPKAVDCLGLIGCGMCLVFSVMVCQVSPLSISAIALFTHSTWECLKDTLPPAYSKH